jgi:hypothetical protein
MIKSRRMRWAGHVTRWGREGMHIGYWWRKKKDGGQDLGGWIIIQAKWILELYACAEWTGFIWLRIGTVRVLLRPRQ